MQRRTLQAAVFGWTFLVSALAAAPAAAQQPLSDVLGFLLTNQSVPTGDFVKDAASTEITRDTITSLLLVELTTLPLSSSSSGFSYRFNSTLGTLERASSSFGPFFTERSLTAGSRQASVGLNVQSARYSRLDGFDLENGTFITTANQFRDESTPFDVEALTLTLRSTTATLFANLGVHDRVDVGVAAPLVWLTLEGARVNTYRGARLLQASAEAEARGLGDLAVRSKVRLVGDTGTGVALVGEVRLPTGDEENLLGSGESSFRTSVVGSIEPGRFSAHGNLGFTVGGLAEEVNYRGALSVSAGSQVTVIGEVLGRRISDVGQLTEERAAHPSIAGVDTIRLINTEGPTYTATFVTGLKWNVGSSWLLNANVSVPLTKRGLRPQVVTLFGLDYAFGGS
ncbi:MAG: hypothetical protein LC791_12270 [Acidobacteria bacterium]|nr:hypothetical protein [Acidobacteriota bacterium]